MELPFHLKTLPPEALDILRYFTSLEETTAHASQITEGSNLTDRGFGKAIRRLVTKGYVAMDGEQVYRLTDHGRRAIEELAEYDVTAPEDSQESDAEPDSHLRRLMVGVPQPLVAGQDVNVFVGFNEAPDEDVLIKSVELIVRVSMLHGEPASAKESPFSLDNDAARQVFEVTAGYYKQARVRVQVFQPSKSSEEIESLGGLYVDVDVVPSAARSQMTAFGANLHVSVPG
jgi:predicted transcriptional regulator